MALLGGRFHSEAMGYELASRSHFAAAQLDTEGADWPDGLPDMVEGYHSLVPLEPWPPEEPSPALGLRTAVVKATSSDDGRPLVLRWLDPSACPPSAEALSAALAAVERWAPLGAHPGLCGLRAAFVSADFFDAPALFVAHDAVAGAVTAEAAHCSGEEGGSGPASEDQLWAYAVQLAALLRATHAAGLALRPASLQPSKLLLCPGGRLRCGSPGLADLLHGQSADEDLAAAQAADFQSVGRALLALGTGAAEGAVLSRLARRVSGALAALLEGLLEGRITACAQLGPALSERALAALDGAHEAADLAVAELAAEAENGRLLRLLCKLGFINERPETDMAPAWAETGDRYGLPCLDPKT